ncbi:SDR family NAD(P)-dependent oxidoreductase [Pseudotabrizicola formosa]|uniref:SDR family NAD(P)-dependent oxidoreductase n=1 Tax=Pseudotabrizicola formosa TaxID=2030009 RepID=UPI000CD2C911|nr:SDR family oxidoreductase [Pseudotabrizicola formosa]
MTLAGAPLTGKRAFITGGGSGVGADLAHGFAEAGAEVVICGRREAPLRAVAEATGARHVLADVTSVPDLTRAFAEAGPCDIVIANAGAADSAPFGKVTAEHWNAMIATNLTGVFLTFQAGLAQLPGWGRLIAIASTAGLKGYAYAAPYAAAKHGTVGLVRSLALEVARKPVTVNALCPGFLDTEMTDRSIATITEKTGKTAEEARTALAATNPQKRLIRPAEVTAAALWLCAPGSESINGQAIAIAGGEL